VLPKWINRPGGGGIPHPEALGLQILQTLPPGFEPGWKGWEGVGVPSGQCPLDNTKLPIAQRELAPISSH